MKSEFKNYLRRKAVIDEEIKKLSKKAEEITYELYMEDDMNNLSNLNKQLDCYKKKINDLHSELEEMEYQFID